LLILLRMTKQGFPSGTALQQVLQAHNVDQRKEGLPKLLREVGFCVTRDSPDLYLKTINRLGLYICTSYKEQMFLDSEDVVLLKSMYCQTIIHFASDIS